MIDNLLPCPFCHRDAQQTLGSGLVSCAFESCPAFLLAVPAESWNTRAAPRQPEGDHGWLVSLELPEVQCNCPWNPDSHDKACAVYLRDRMADAQRAIAELQDKLDDARSARDAYGQNAIDLQAERDTLRQQLSERDAEIERLHRCYETLHEVSNRRGEQRDKLAGLLRETLDIKEAWYLKDRINAALAELK